MARLLKPQSATNFSVSVVALAFGMLSLWIVALDQEPAPSEYFPYRPLLPCLIIVIVIAIFERCWPALRAPSAAFSTVPLRPRSLRRVAVRLCGLFATLALVAFAYWLLPEYAGEFYRPYWQFLRTIAGLLLVVPFYLAWADRYSKDEHDEYYEFGRFILGGWGSADRNMIALHVAGWTVKAFFLPLMTVYLSDEVRALQAAWHEAGSGTMPAYQILYHFFYTLDLIYCVVGYTVSIRLFDAHIRSVEPTVGGWVVALVCYQPFYAIIGRYYLAYDDGIFWDNWLQNLPLVQAVWAACIGALLTIYALSTVAFGLRFSNLTNRGIITGGPYRFTKHPAYIAKCFSWWLISVPFISDQSWSVAVRNCCLLALLNLIYYARARTEERHLSRDPAYVAYARWMNEHGLFKSWSRVLPWLRYRDPGKARQGAYVK